MWRNKHSLGQTPSFNMLILLLHTLIEGLAGLVFLFVPEVANLLPGFEQIDSPTSLMLLRMYGLAALLLAGLSLVAYLRKRNRELLLVITGLLAAFHFAMAVVLAISNPDHRAMLFHFLLGLFIAGTYVRERRTAWEDVSK
jgi:ABC-type Mn2+/Zn2+ transport system permease subunit